MWGSGSACNEQCLITLITDNVMLFIFQKILLFWKVFGWSRIIRISTKACSFASRQFFTYFNVFSKTLWHWNKWQKMRGWTRASQKSHANQRKICLHLNCLLSLSKMVSRYLSVVQALLSFAAPPNLHCVLSICERKKVEKPLLQIQVHKRKGHLKPTA